MNNSKLMFKTAQFIARELSGVAIQIGDIP